MAEKMEGRLSVKDTESNNRDLQFVDEQCEWNAGGAECDNGDGL